jgi:uncharacterized protein
VHLSALFLYPVKSLAGCAVSSAAIDPLGLAGDRRFMVIDEFGRFLTQRTLPRMALIATALTADTLSLSANTASGTVEVARASDPNAPLHTVSVWKSENLLAEDCGDAPAAWLGDFLGLRCRLVRAGEKFCRTIPKPSAHAGDSVSFADAYPVLVTSEASLADLNDRLAAQGEEVLPMNRFRPNLVVSGCPAFAEDSWARVRIGEMIFRAGGPCARCVVTTIDQLTAARGKEPLRTLAGYRRATDDPTNVNFGQNLIHETKSGILRIGDPVVVL